MAVQPSEPSQSKPFGSLPALRHRCSTWLDRARYLLGEALRTDDTGGHGCDGLNATALEQRLLLSATPIVQAVAETGADGSAAEMPLTPAADTTTAAQPRRELVIIDPAAADHEQLLLDLAETNASVTDVLVLDGSRDGLAQITEWLAEYEDIDAVHIVSHGEDGALRLGNSWLSNETLPEHTQALSQWQASLRADADLLFYGCDLAASQQGQELIDALARITDGDVAASTDDTGHALFGGDWILEYSTGHIETDIAFSQHLQQNWGHLLNVTVDATSTATAASETDSRSVSHTTSGTDRLMLVGISFGEDKGERVSSVSYNGKALSRVGAQDHNDGSTARVEIWSLLAPDLGTHNVHVSFTDEEHEGATIGVMTFNGVDQEAALGSFASRQGTSSTLSADVSSADGETVFSVAALNDSNNYNLVPGGGQTEYWDLHRSKANGSGTLMAGAASVTPTWSVATSGKWAVGAVPIRAADYSLTSGTEVRVNSTTGSSQQTSLEGRGSHRSVALADSGDYVVVWSSNNQDGSGWGVYAQRYDRLGVAQGGEIHVSSGTTVNDQHWATVGMDAAGNFVVAWTNKTGLGDADVMARRYDSAGNALGGEFRVNDASLSARSTPSIAVASDGRFVIAWKGLDALGDADIYARRFAANGAALDGSDLIVAGGAGNDYDPAVAINDSGDFAVLWDDAGGVKLRRYLADGSPVGGTITVDGSTNAGNGALAMHQDGSLVVTWREGNAGSRDVRMRRYDNGGNPLSSAVNVATTGGGDQQDPSIDMDDAGNFIIVWEGNGDQTGQVDSSGVFGQKYDASGNRVGDEFRINQTTGGTQDQASVAMQDLNHFIAVWTGNGQQAGQADTAGVFARRFGTPIDGQLLFTTDGSADGGGNNWNDNEILRFGDASDAFDPASGVTSGTIAKLPGFVAPYDIRAMHYVQSTVTLGTTGTQFTVQHGDLILSFDTGGGAGTVGGLSVDGKDILVFRPDTPGNYSSGTYSMLIDGDGAVADSGVHDATTTFDVHALSLVEQDTVVGGTTLTKGTFLVAHSDASLHHNIYTFNVVGTGIGAATETTDTELLLGGQPLGLDPISGSPRELQGLHLLQRATYFGGTQLASGTLLVVVDGPDTYGGQVVDQFDVAALSVTQTEQDAAAGTAATALLLFDGTDMTIDNPAGESFNGITVFDSLSMPANQAPTASAGGSYSITEGQSLNLTAAASSDPDGHPLAFRWDLDNDGVYGETGEPTAMSPTVSWATLAGAGIDDDGTYTIGVQVDDGYGGVATATATLTVANQAPDLVVSGDANGTEDAVYSLNLSAIDAGDDTITSWTVDWGDGNTTTHNFAAGTATHTYTRGGNYNILVAATDEDGTHTERELLVGEYSGGSDKIYRFDANTGSLIGLLDNSGGQLSRPLQMLVGPGGMVYVAGFDSDNVVRYAADGTYLGEFVAAGSGGLNGAAGLAFDAEGNLYVSSFNTDQILRYDSTGAFVDVFADDSSGIDGPLGLTFGPDGDLYASSWKKKELYRFDISTGGATQVISTGLSGAYQIAFDSAGNLLLADGSANEIKKYDGGLSTLAVGIDKAEGLAVSPEGILYASAYDDDKILMFDTTTGAALGTLVTAGTGGLDHPSFIALLPDHQVSVAHVTDTPTVTDASTVQNVQSTSGLVLSPNATNPSGTTHYKITGISGGTLYHNDGTTPISNGDFITVAQGSAGLKFTPTNDFTGTASFDVQASSSGLDSGLGGDTVTASITVSANLAPNVSLTNIVASIDENTDTTGGLKVADIVISDDGVGANLLSLAGADAGAFEIVGNDLKLKSGVSLDFETKSQYDVRVRVDDNTIGGTPDDTVDLRIDLNDVNEVPVGAISDNDAAANQVAEDAAVGTAVGLTAQASDADATNNTVTYSLDDSAGGRFAIDAASGVVTVAGGLDAETDTSHSIVVRARSSDGSSSTRTFTVAVLDRNDNAPVWTSPANVSIAENQALQHTLVTTDADLTPDTVTYTITGGADQSRFSIISNDRLHAPAFDFEAPSDVGANNVYEVEITARDGVGASTVQTVLITVTDVNEPPAITAIADQRFDEDTSSGPLAFVVGDGESAASDLTVTAVTDNPALFAADGLVLGGSGANRTITLSPSANQSGTATVTVTASDGVYSTTTSFVVQVDAVNDTPQITPIGSQTVPEDVRSNLGITIDDVDDAEHTLVVTATSDNQALISDASIWVTAGGRDRTLSFEPVANQTGSATITVTVSDGVTSSSESFVVEVQDVNDAPVIDSPANAITTAEDTPQTVSLASWFQDIDDATLEYRVDVADGSQLRASIQGDDLHVTPRNHWHGTTQIHVRAIDDSGASVTHTVNVTVTPVNDRPVGRADRIVVTDEVIRFSVADLLANDIDVDGDALTVQILTLPEEGVLVDLGGGQFEYRSDGRGDVSFTYRLSDGTTTSDPVCVHLAPPLVPPPTHTAPIAAPVAPPAEPSVESEPADSDADADAASEQSEESETGQDAAAPAVPNAPVESGQAVQASTTGVDPTAAVLAAKTAPPAGWTLVAEQTLETVVETAERAVGETPLAEQAEELRTAYATAASQIRAAITQPQMWQAIHSMQNEVGSSVSNTTVTIGATVTATTSITVGYVVWVIRGGILLSSVMANLPMWRLMDPMAILNAVDGTEDDGESLESMVEEAPPQTDADR
ncbi:DUF4347 domain-containing protein [Roseimaritima sediminicola]|uniref:DUF4347 domain-containing protein n=1 Tax=Roseimaritima sediminicola TaxID=2662066 RepID=UPI0012982CC3|nr:DUF4347 domain-containing protein [Roseimaritima sediminicola]